MPMYYPSQPPTTADYDKLRQVFESSLKIMQQTRNLPIQEIMKVAVNKATEITESQIGYFHFVDSDEKTIDLITWSTNTLKYCSVPDKETHYPFKEAGVWIDCIHYKRPVIYNDYPSLSHRKGLPEGHVAVKRIVSLPVIEDNKVVAIIGVGNKKTDYDDFDVYRLSLLAESVWNIVQRKRAESAVEEVNNLLASQTQDTVTSLLEINTQLKKQLMRQQSIEAALRKHSEQISDLQVWGKIGLWQYNLSTQKIRWSPMVYFLFGISHPSTAETSLDELPLFFTESAYGQFCSKLNELTQQQQTIQYDFEIQVGDNTTRHLICAMQPIINDNKEIVEIRGFFQDFTEWLQEEKLQFALELERERREILSNFVTQASHEFKTPLSVIKTNSYLISRNYPSGTEPKQITAINNQVDRLSKLVNNLIEITKLERQSSSQQEVEVQSLINDVLVNHHHTITKHNLTIETTLHPIPLYTTGIETLLFQALWQVLDNAIRFSLDDSTIRVRAAYDGKDIIIEIQDEGVGIAEADLPHIFESFFRVDKAHTTAGFGLGLTIAKDIIELHQGKITVDSVLGEGTVCRIYLPIAKK